MNTLRSLARPALAAAVLTAAFATGAAHAYGPRTAATAPHPLPAAADCRTVSSTPVHGPRQNLGGVTLACEKDGTAEFKAVEAKPAGSAYGPRNTLHR